MRVEFDLSESINDRTPSPPIWPPERLRVVRVEFDLSESLND